jgi:hypothetical protein
VSDPFDYSGTGLDAVAAAASMMWDRPLGVSEPEFKWGDPIDGQVFIPGLALPPELRARFDLLLSRWKDPAWVGSDRTYVTGLCAHELACLLDGCYRHEPPLGEKP